MGVLHFVGGEKGGVGKSFTARLLAQFYVDQQQAFLGFDSDQSHSTFSRFYSDFVSPVTVQNYDSLDAIIEAAEDNPEGNLIVDLAAQTSAKLNEWMTSCDLLGLMQELGYRVFFWHVMDDSADSMNLLGKTLDQLADHEAQLVVVENFGRGQSFRNFEQSQTYVRAKQAAVKFVLLARLHDALAQKIDFNNFSFWAAANSKNFMKTADRHRVKVWLNHAYSQVQQVLAEPAQSAGTADSAASAVPESSPAFG